MTDIRIQDDGSLVILHGVSEAGQAWLKDNIQLAARHTRVVVVCVPGYVLAIVNGMLADGLEQIARRLPASS
jgi:hypothetical protein